MANAYTIDKIDAETKKDLVKDLLSDIPVNRIANNYGLSVSCVRRYRESKLFKAIAEVWAERQENITAEYEQQLAVIQERLNKALDAVDQELDRNHQGKYDLSDPRRAIFYVKMLNETSKSLQSNLITLAKISGNIKDVVEEQSQPYKLYAGLIEAINKFATTEIVKKDIVNCLKQLRKTLPGERGLT